MQTRRYPATDHFLDTLLQRHAAVLGPVFSDPGKYRLQVIYTRIDRDARNRPRFKDYYYRVDTGLYFYPASTVKLPEAVLALEKLNDLGRPGLDRHTPMFTDSLAGITPAVTADSTAANGLPSIGHYIKKIFLVSDNDAANRLYEFIGQEPLNRRLWELGFGGTQLRHRVGIGGVTPEENRHTNAVSFRQNGREVYRQPEQVSRLVFSPRRDFAGKGYYDDQERLVNAPLDFSQKNRIPLPDLHEMLRRIIFPEAVTKDRQFRLNESDYRFLYRCMSQLPTETAHPAYDTTEFHRHYVKFLLFGGQKDAAPKANIRIFNKPGWAYGFLNDVAYIADFDNQVEFLLSATVYVNEDGILSDEHYQFDETGKPFMKALGEIIYEYELHRHKSHLPDLSRYKLNYEKDTD